jgi:L-cysteine S-thiosulfotransferase
MARMVPILLPALLYSPTLSHSNGKLGHRFRQIRTLGLKLGQHPAVGSWPVGASDCGQLLLAALAVATSILVAGALVFACASASAAPAESPRPYRVVGDAIPESLTGMPGDPQRGRAIVTSRQTGLCLLCHSAPLPQEKFQGTIGPDLKGAGSRYTEGQLRLRIVNSSLLDPNTIMPAYYRLDGLDRVAPAFRGKTVLTAQEIEDVVAFLKMLRDDDTTR